MKKRFISEDELNYQKMMDTQALEMEHGKASYDHKIPSLETLCIRSLHNSGCSFAKDETDGAVIQYKAMFPESK